MVGAGVVTGEKAGTRGIDELLRAECPLWGAVGGCAVPEAPLLADAVEEGRWKGQAQHVLIWLSLALGCHSESQEPRTLRASGSPNAW